MGDNSSNFKVRVTPRALLTEVTGCPSARFLMKKLK